MIREALRRAKQDALYRAVWAQGKETGESLGVSKTINNSQVVINNSVRQKPPTEATHQTEDNNIWA